MFLHAITLGFAPVGAPWLPVAFATVMAFIILMYVLLDGFDLGVGILFAVERDAEARDVMVNSIAPVWDGNETWLVLGGSTLYGAFPLAYAVVLPSVYPLLILMLMALIFRGSAFEFRFRAPKAWQRKMWDYGFLAGSVIAAFSQGAILGALMQGTTIADRQFAGGSLSWFSPFAMFCGLGVVIGYALLGATWVIWRAGGRLRRDMRARARVLGVATLGVFGVVSVWSPLLHRQFFTRWFAWPGVIATAVAPVSVLVLAFIFFRHLRAEDDNKRDITPFVCTLGFFAVAFGGLGYSIFPLIVPPSLDIWHAASPVPSEQFLLVGVLVLIPIIVAYNAFAYYIFKGKIEPGAHYH